MSRVFEKIIGVIGWLQIVASPLLAGIIIGALIYFPNSNTTTLVISLIVVTISLFIGIYFANKVARKKGTMSFLSQTDATPDIDEWIGSETKNKK